MKTKKEVLLFCVSSDVRDVRHPFFGKNSCSHLVLSTAKVSYFLEFRFSRYKTVMLLFPELYIPTSAGKKIDFQNLYIKSSNLYFVNRSLGHHS